MADVRTLPPCDGDIVVLNEAAIDAAREAEEAQVRALVAKNALLDALEARAQGRPVESSVGPSV